MRLHKKVNLWWGRWWAVQFTRLWDDWSLGVRINTSRWMIDFYAGPLTVSLGKHAVYTDPRTRSWDSCRGMMFPDDARFPQDNASEFLTTDGTDEHGCRNGKGFGTEMSAEEARVL